jgi:hypothetical protein
MAAGCPTNLVKFPELCSKLRFDSSGLLRRNNADDCAAATAEKNDALTRGMITRQLEALSDNFCRARLALWAFSGWIL